MLLISIGDLSCLSFSPSQIVLRIKSLLKGDAVEQDDINRLTTIFDAFIIGIYALQMKIERSHKTSSN
jgi:hypothetical protein